MKKTTRRKAPAQAKAKDAIALLESQHREVESMFEELEASNDPNARTEVFNQLADALAIHAAIEEHHFYPAVRERRTEDVLLESLEEHLGIKRVIADLLKTQPTDDTFDAKIAVLKEQVEHHVEEEEEELFPQVEKLFSKQELIDLAQPMLEEQTTLEGNNPRENVPSETQEAATLAG